MPRRLVPHRDRQSRRLYPHVRHLGRGRRGSRRLAGEADVKVIAAIATGVLIMTSAAEAAPARPAVEHYGQPMLNGQPLPFSDAVRVGDVLYLSGQLGRGSDGKLPDGIEAQTKQALENVGAVLKRAGLGY